METSKKLRKKLFWRRIRMKITWMWRGILCFFAICYFTAFGF